MEEAGTRRFWERVAGAFLTCLAAAVLAWWTAILWHRPWMTRYLPKGLPPAWLHGLLVADLVLYAGAAAAAGLGFWRRRPWAFPVLCVHLGAAGYVTLMCLSLALITGSAAVNVALMAPPWAAAAWLAWRLRPSCGGDHDAP